MQELLTIYVNDHLAVATGAAQLARRLADADHHRPGGQTLTRLAEELEQDRATLEEVVVALGGRVRRYKTWFASGAEKVGRLKPNGHLVTRSPLSRVLELETLLTARAASASAWRVLRDRDDHRLAGFPFDALLARTDEVADLLAEAARDAFGQVVSGSPRTSDR